MEALNSALEGLYEVDPCPAALKCQGWSHVSCTSCLQAEALSEAPLELQPLLCRPT